MTPPASCSAPSRSSPSGAAAPPGPARPGGPSPGPLPLDRAEAGGDGAMVTSGHSPHAMSAVTPTEARVPGSGFTPHHYKPFSSHAHYQQVMCALRKLKESGFYWGAVSGREASSLLRSEPPGTFLIRDSSDHHHFFALSVQTVCGTKNLRIHSQDAGFFLQPDPQNTIEPPHFDCVLKLVAHYMGKSRAADLPGQIRSHNVYLIHTGGERVPLDLRRPLCTSLSSLQHLCRRTLNNTGLGATSERPAQLPHTLRDFLDEYDAPI